jgi:hypothetical protein
MKINYIGKSEPIRFAALELKRYTEQIDKSLETILIQRSKYEEPKRYGNEIIIWIGCDPALESFLPKVKEKEYDDGIYISLKDSAGLITGTNERSVLIGVYRFLRELGCEWVFPGKYGERIPDKKLSSINVQICEVASCRHRGTVIEGAVSFTHVLNMIQWLPKVGMNAYFNQFKIPFTFYNFWYTHENNPELEPHSLTVEEVAGMTADMVTEIKKRGMLLHAVGHCWTCGSLGIEGTGWNVTNDTVPEESVKYLAMLNGKRELYQGIPMRTQLCYGNPEARDIITDTVFKYCKENPQADYVHFWLGDGFNNECECEKCRDTRPADFYIMMLNRLDVLLSNEGIKTKIVFLLYFDLLWEPEKEKIKNPDRFVMMFAPISRSYSSTYGDSLVSAAQDTEPFIRNKMTLPSGVAENCSFLKKWKKREPFCDSFVMDYHIMWDHYADPGYACVGKILFKDMKDLAKLDLNGMISGQPQRVAFPTGCPMSLMTTALWNKNASFELESARYFKASYGEDGLLVQTYLEKLTEAFNPVYLRHETERVDPNHVKRLEQIDVILNEFEQVIENHILEYEAVKTGLCFSWKMLKIHSALCRILAKCFIARASGNAGKSIDLLNDAFAFLRFNELEVNEVLDVYNYIKTLRKIVETMGNLF